MWDVVGEVNGEDVIYLITCRNRRGNYGDGEIIEIKSSDYFDGSDVKYNCTYIFQIFLINFKTYSIILELIVLMTI